VHSNFECLLGYVTAVAHTLSCFEVLGKDCAKRGPASAIESGADCIESCTYLFFIVYVQE
jgi:hypothetical protein